MSKTATVVVTILIALLLLGVVYFNFTPSGRAVWNNWFFKVQKVDDTTRYATRKQVEDSCRAMMASYTSDKMTFDQYKDSDSAEKQSWAEQARMRANKTAASYNEYVLKNSFVWEGNVPNDILVSLPYLQ